MHHSPISCVLSIFIFVTSHKTIITFLPNSLIILSVVSFIALATAFLAAFFSGIFFISLHASLFCCILSITNISTPRVHCSVVSYPLPTSPHHVFIVLLYLIHYQHLHTTCSLFCCILSITNISTPRIHCSVVSYPLPTSPHHVFIVLLYLIHYQHLHTTCSLFCCILSNISTPRVCGIPHRLYLENYLAWNSFYMHFPRPVYHSFCFVIQYFFAIVLTFLAFCSIVCTVVSTHKLIIFHFLRTRRL